MVHFLEDDVIIRKGDLGSTFYIITSGQVTCTGLDQGKDLELGPDNYFGERALMYNEPRAATVVALTDVTCMTLDRASFDSLLGGLKETLDYNLTMRVLKSIPFLSLMETTVRKRLQSLLKKQTFSAGDCICQQGKRAEGMYILRSGEVKAYTEGEESTAIKGVQGCYYNEKAIEMEYYNNERNIVAVSDVTAYLLTHSMYLVSVDQSKSESEKVLSVVSESFN